MLRSLDVTRTNLGSWWRWWLWCAGSLTLDLEEGIVKLALARARPHSLKVTAAWTSSVSALSPVAMVPGPTLHWNKLTASKANHVLVPSCTSNAEENSKRL